MEIPDENLTLSGSAVNERAFIGSGSYFTSTLDGKVINIPAESFDTPAAKQFLSTGKNSYTGNADAIKAGKKVFQLHSCSQCHGSYGQGQVGPSLIDDDWVYPKNTKDQGMFETIWGGSSGGMGAKGKGLMLPDDPSQGLMPNEVLQVIAFLRSNAIGSAKPAEAASAEAAPAAATPATDSAISEPAAASSNTAQKPVKKSAKKSTSKKRTKAKKA